MKKAYIILFLISNILSTSCMDILRRRKSRTSNELIPIKPQQSYSASPGKQVVFLEEKPSSSTIIPLLSNNTIVEKLYNDVSAFIQINMNGYLLRSDQLRSKKLSHLITSMNKAQSNGFHEDYMGIFSHNKNCSHPQIPLFFGCLKKYRLTTSTTNETLPFYNKEKAEPLFDNSLAYALGITNSPTQYPAYIHLTHCLSALSLQKIETVTTLASCLYKNQHILFKNEAVSYTDLKNDFYNRAYDLLQDGLSFDVRSKSNDIYNLLHIIEKAKINKDIDQERNLGDGIINTKPKAVLDWFIDEDLNSTKNRISLFCIFIEKYNRARGNKKIPTGEQYDCYCLQQKIDLAFPDSFNSTLFDKNIYAFTEFEQLTSDTQKLMNSDDETVQQSVDQIYNLKG
jgi:hypothetical protein